MVSKNSGDKYGRTRTLKNALANSVNTVTARLMDRIGPRTVVKLAKDLGIEQRILRYHPLLWELLTLACMKWLRHIQLCK